jgi:hypothetical protein
MIGQYHEAVIEQALLAGEVELASPSHRGIEFLIKPIDLTVQLTYRSRGSRIKPSGR